jgi:hypothetical protein
MRCALFCTHRPTVPASRDPRRLVQPCRTNRRHGQAGRRVRPSIRPQTRELPARSQPLLASEIREVSIQPSAAVPPGFGPRPFAGSSPSGHVRVGRAAPRPPPRRSARDSQTSIRASVPCDRAPSEGLPARRRTSPHLLRGERQPAR